MADNGYAKYSGFGGGSGSSAGVSSLNLLTGGLTLVGGTGITITPVGSNITIASTATGVTSVGLVDSTGLFTISGSPVTSTGNLTLASLNSQTANRVFAAPNGSFGTPGFRALVAADIPPVTNVAGGVAGSLPYQTATSATGMLAIGSANQVLTVVSGLPSWQNATAGFANPMTTLGDIIYENSTPAPARLAGNTTSTKNFLTQTGTGSVSAAPVWGTIAVGDVPTLNQNTTGTAANITGTTNATLTTLSALTTASSLASVGTITSGTWSGTTIAVNKGGTGVTAVTTAPTATSWAGWDSNLNLSANNIIEGFATTATSGGTTTLTAASAYSQYFTGTTTQTVVLPSTGVVAGQQFFIVNKSTGAVTVQSSNTNTIQTMYTGNQLLVTALVAAPTTAANWSSSYQATNTVPVYLGGTGMTSITAGSILVGAGTSTPTLVAPSTSGNVLTSNGSTWVSQAPSTAPGTTYYKGYYPSSTSNYWSTTSASFTNFTVTGTIPSPTVLVNSGFTTPTLPTGNLPGITFTAPRTGVIEVQFNVNTLLSAAQASDIRLIEANSSTILDYGSIGNISVIEEAMMITMNGYFPVTASTSYTFKVQGQTNAGTVYIGSTSVFLGLSMAMKYIT